MEHLNFTLFHTEENGVKVNYGLQLVTTFSEAGFQQNGSEIMSIPESDGGILKIQLFFKSGDENEVSHNIENLTFPLSGISNWFLEVEFFDDDGNEIRDKGQTAQAEGSSRPRPLTNLVL